MKYYSSHNTFPCTQLCVTQKLKNGNDDLLNNAFKAQKIYIKEVEESLNHLLTILIVPLTLRQIPHP
jgi:hypothetical protein